MDSYRPAVKKLQSGATDDSASLELTDASGDMEQQQRADQEISSLTDRGVLLEQLRDEVHLEMTSENYIGAHSFMAAKRPDIKLKLLIQGLFLT
ncbi:hypothetical protein G3G77_004172 [Salmonella enterica]|nr:hypothetical protein [Salmonella enterica]EEH5466056.1 hypothetical protein [Salmonella enterica]EEH7555500.1 hypothetical protein [Salmonella enterica]EEO5639864.1 hypothetical protein [Salmonella enterica]EEQ0204450.1 hypothetical protein [Salmonella enterica]